ncbi:anti-sigma factor [Streptomyces sp. NPDC006512]|uniref:anti-sigma factor n=1 Tax=Streptomyces sp. NPDC006512 TaxID=3154307 RepID=UPI0033B879FA
MSTDDPHGATGAYVLDALPAAERAAFEAHLETCADCAREVRELAATAALLGSAVAVEPPPGFRDEVLRRIREAPAGPPPLPAPKAPARHAARGGRPRAHWVLAACVAAAAGLGGVALWQFREADGSRQEARRAEARAAALTQVLSAPDARLASGRLADGGTGTVVVSRDRDRAVFVSSGMAAPPPGRVYQLWFADPGAGMRPAGLMDPARPDAPALLAGPVGAATGIGVTVEPAGGSPAPTSDPLVVLAFPPPKAT